MNISHHHTNKALRLLIFALYAIAPSMALAQFDDNPSYRPSYHNSVRRDRDMLPLDTGFTQRNALTVNPPLIAGRGAYGLQLEHIVSYNVALQFGLGITGRDRVFELFHRFPGWICGDRGPYSSTYQGFYGSAGVIFFANPQHTLEGTYFEPRLRFFRYVVNNTDPIFASINGGRYPTDVSYNITDFCLIFGTKGGFSQESPFYFDTNIGLGGRAVIGRDVTVGRGSFLCSDDPPTIVHDTELILLVTASFSLGIRF